VIGQFKRCEPRIFNVGCKKSVEPLIRAVRTRKRLEGNYSKLHFSNVTENISILTRSQQKKSLQSEMKNQKMVTTGENQLGPYSKMLNFENMALLRSTISKNQKLQIHLDFIKSK